MSFDDFEVVAYKIMAYLSSCLKGGVTPNGAKARELSRVNGLYFDAVVSSLFDKGLVSGNLIRDMNGEPIEICSLTLTLDGAIFLKENSRMAKVRETLGDAFERVLSAAAAASSLL